MYEDWSSEKNASADIDGLCDNVKDDVLKALKKSDVPEYRALNYIEKTDEGFLYIVKVRINDRADGCIHVKLMKETDDGLPKFEDLLQNKFSDDRIESF